MAEKDAIIRLKILANNDTSGVFSALAATLEGISAAANSVKTAFESALPFISSMATSLEKIAGPALTDKEKLDALASSVTKVGTDFKAMEEKVTPAAASFSKSVDNAAEKGKKLSTIDWAGLQLAGQQIGQFGDKVGGVFVDAVKESATFEYNMSRIYAVLSSKEPNVNMEALKAKAIELAKNSKFSADEQAQGMYDLARQGLTSTQILGQGANGAASIVNDLAQSIDGDMRESATVVTDVMREFNLSGDDLRKVANTMSGALHNSSMTLNDFYYALKQVGPVASSMHQSVTDTATAIALMGMHGITGASAGTALKNMLLGLEPHTKKAKEIMDDLGISTKDGAADSFYTLEGTLKTLPDILGILNDKFGGLNDHMKQQAIASVFTKYGMAGVITLVGETKDKFVELSDTLAKDDAARIAHDKLDNLYGDTVRLIASTKTLSKEFGDTLNPELRKLAHNVNEIIDKLHSLSPENKKLLMETIGVGSAFAIVIGGLATFLSTIALLKPGFTMMWNAIKGVGVVIGLLAEGFWLLVEAIGTAIMWIAFVIGEMTPIGWLITAIVVVVVALATAIALNWGKIKTWTVEAWGTVKTKTEEVWDAVSSWLSKTWDNITKWSKETWDSVTKWLKEAWETIKTKTTEFIDFFKPAVTGTWDAIKTATELVWGTIKEVFHEVWELIKTIVAAAVVIIYDVFTGKWNEIGDVFTAAKKKWSDITHETTEKLKTLWHNGTEHIKKTLHDGWDHIGKTFDDKTEEIKTSLGKWWSNVKTSFADSWQDIVLDAPKKLSQFIKNTRDKFDEFRKSTGEKLDEAKIAIKTWVHDLGVSILEWFKDVGQAFSDAWDQIVIWFKSLPDQAAKFGEDIVKGLASGISNAVHWVTDSVKSVVDSAKNFLGMGGGSSTPAPESAPVAPPPPPPTPIPISEDNFLPDWYLSGMIPHFAVGGKVDKPTVALVGEAGPEWVIPQSAFDNQSGFSFGLSGLSMGNNGRGQVVINIQNINVVTNNPNNGRQIGNDISQAIRQQMAFSF